MAVISDLAVYPVKSCGGINVERALMTPQGLMYDRRWMIIHEQTGRAVTQRTDPKMAQIKVSMPPEAVAGEEPPFGAVLSLSAPGVSGGVAVPLTITGQPSLRKAKVWEWSGVAADEGDEAATWLTTFLGRPVRLVRYLGSLEPAAAEEAAAALAAQAVVGGEGASGVEGAKAQLSRAVDPDYVPWGAEVAFSDGFPVLLATSESLHDLNSKLQQKDQTPVPINRFRANIILSGSGAPWSEDGFGLIKVGGADGSGSGGDGAGTNGGSGGVEVALVKPCSRCTVPLVDQETGTVKNKEPIATMQEFRSCRVLKWDKKFGGLGATFFGHNGQPLGTSLIKVGDPISVMRNQDYAAAAAP